MTATKEQERKALEKIKAIVAELGDISYVGTAFKGAFDYADQNIEYDAAFSHADECDSLRQDLKETKELAERFERDLEITNGTKSRLNDRIEDLQNKLRELTEKFTAASETNLMLEDINAAFQKQTIELKAKLYDMMTAGA